MRMLKIFSVIFLVGLCATVLADELKTEIQDALNANDTALAIDLIQQEIDSDPAYHGNYYQLGRIFYVRGQFKIAAEQFELALDKKSKHYESLYHLGLCRLELGDIEGAREAFDKGQKKDRKHKGWFLYGLGRVFMVEENFQEADKKFREAIIETEQNPEQYTAKEKAEYHISLGDANYRQGIPALAIGQYEIAQELDTGSVEVYYHWADACLETRDYQCAMDKLRLVLTEDSLYAPAWLRAGGIYFKIARSSRNREERTERFKSVVGSYKRYLDLTNAQADSSTVRLFYELGRSYTELRGYEDAVDAFEKVLSIPYEPRDIYFHYGKALVITRQYEKASEAFQKHLVWLENLPTDFTSAVDTLELFQYMGDCFYYRKPAEFYEAIKWYTRAIDGGKDQRRLIQNTAVAYHQVKMYRDALNYYDQRIAMGIDSNYSSMYKNAGFCALNLANQEESGEDEDDIDIDEDMPEVEVEPDTVDYYRLATAYFEDFLTYKSDDAKVVELVANTYLYNLRDCAKGVSYLERLITLDPSNCSARRSLGFAYFSPETICTQNYSKALGYFRKAYDCVAAASGPCGDIDLTLWIAQAYHLRAADTKSKEDFKSAFEWYGKVLKCDPGNKPALEGRDQTQFEF
jgi:tetratricopeptide (TPR) repeat protein